MSVFERLTGGPHPADVREEMLALKEPERRKRAKKAERELEKIAWRGGRARPSKRWRAAAIAWVGTATARKIAADFWWIGGELQDDAQLSDDVYVVLAARGKAFFETVARGLLRADGGFGGWPLVRRAVREGLIEPPEGDAYLRRLVAEIASPASAMGELDSVYKGLLADPGLLEREVWQLFEVDAGDVLSNATTFEPPERADEWAYTRGENTWLYALSRLAEESRLDRARLLDASLDALMRDFRASTVGWYARLHEELEPTREERLQRVDRYLALVTSPAPVIVKEGLAALRELEDAVPPRDFARVAPTPFTQRQKNLSMETLSLLARLCKRHAGNTRAELLDAAVHALGHERADVQDRALRLLELYPDDAPRAALLGYVEAVSPTLRPRVEALAGVADLGAAEVSVELRPPAQPRVTPELVRERNAELAPVASVDELIELAVMLVEGNGDGDDCERFLDGVSRLCDQRPAGFDRRVAGLLKRAGEASAWSGGAQAAGAEVVAHVVQAWTRRRRPRVAFTYSRTIIGFLARRADEVARRAASSATGSLLAFPTHRGGWIDPDVLERRLGAAGRISNRPDPLDRVQARARAFPPVDRIEYVRSVHTVSRWGRPSRHLRLVCEAVPSELGDLGPPTAEAGALHDESSWYGEVGWAGLDALGVRWALTVLPSLPEVAFAGAASAAVEARDGSAYHHPEAVLDYAVDAHVPLGREAWLAVAACLVAKPPELQRVAVDLLLASIEDGRFDAEALGQELAWLADNDFAKPTRLEAPLRDVARVSPLHAAQTVRAVEHMVGHLTTRPHGLHAPLEIAVENATATGRRIEDERARAALERIAADVSRSSKLGRLARSLLER